MKPPKAALVAIATLTSALNAQPAQLTTNVLALRSLLEREVHSFVKERGEHHKIWENVHLVTNRAGDIVTIRAITNSYTELATGLHFRGADGLWKDSDPEISLGRDGGAEARKIPHKVWFAPDIRTPGAVRLTLPGGQTIAITIRGIFLYDRSTGRSVLLAETVSRIGELHRPNKVIYPKCFGEGVDADVVLTVTKRGFEQDIVLRERPDFQPEDFGMDRATTTIEIWSEIFESPEPAKRVTTVRAPDSPDAEHTSLKDEVLTFPGGMRMGPGFAFPINDPARRHAPRIATGKSWETLEGRRFLVESTRWRDAAPHLGRLPAKSVAQTNAAGPAAVRGASLKRTLPSVLVADATPSNKQIQAAVPSDRDKQIAFVFDYFMELNQSQPGFHFEGDMTYLVSSAVDLRGGPVIIDAGVVVKFSEGGSILVDGPITSHATNYHMAVFTSKNDNSVGSRVVGSTGNPELDRFAFPALQIEGGHPVNLGHFRIAYASVGIMFLTPAPSATLSHAQILNTYLPVYSYMNNLNLRNVLVHWADAIAEGENFSVTAEHVTAHQLFNLCIDHAVSGTLGTLTMKNSLIVGVNGIGMENELTFSPWYNGGAPVFQSCGSAAHFPAEAYRITAGLDIDPALRTALREKTIYPPATLSGPVPTTTLERTVPRGDGDELFSGYYYDALDIVVSGLVIEPAATLRIDPGTTIGVDFTSSHFGIQLGEGSQLISEGAPLSPNRFVAINGVHEGQCSWPYWPAPEWATFHGGWTANNAARFRFTEFPAQASDYSYLIYRFSRAGDFEFNDCRLYGGWLFSETDLNLTARNTLFLRSRIDFNAVDGEIFFDVRNNLFKDIFWFVVNDSVFHFGEAFIFHDNVFDEANLLYDFPPISSHNRFYPFNPLGTANGNNTMSQPIYSSRHLGNYYLEANGADLVNQSSRNASEAGLFHYTLTGTAREGSSLVDIGMHYLMTDASGNPLDTDGDSKPDYLEDPNGNGKTDSGEYSWSNPVITFTPGPMNYPIGWPGQIIDATARVTDIDSPDPIQIAGGMLTVALISGAQEGDRLTIRNWGTQAKQVGTNYSHPNWHVTYGGVGIGTFAGGTIHAALRIDFTAGATIEAAQAVLTNLCFHNVYGSVAQGQRTLQIVMEDGRGGASSLGSKVINVDECPGQLDVVLLLDVSNSLNQLPAGAFAHERSSATQLVSQIELPLLDRAGLVTFCGTANRAVAMTTNEAALKEGINITATCAGTRFDDPINEAQTMLFENQRYDAAKLVILMTDGKTPSPDDARIAASRAKELGIRLFTIGFGTHADIDTNLLQEMASWPTDYLRVPYTPLLRGEISLLARRFCRASGAPIVSISAPSEIDIDETPTLTGSFTDDGIPEEPVITSSWSVIAGPGAVTLIPNAGNPLEVTASFSKPGVYQISLHVSDSFQSGSATATITVTNDNAPPVVSAGPDQTITLLERAYLPGMVSDDGLPDENLTVQWLTTAPGTVTFDNDGQEAETLVTFKAPGIYTLRLTATDSAGLSRFDDVRINVEEDKLWQFTSTDVVSAGIGGLRDFGYGEITLENVVGTVNKAFLFWHGPTDVDDTNANSVLLLNDRVVTGNYMGSSHHNGWRFRGHIYDNSQAYWADISHQVVEFRNGQYSLKRLYKSEEVNINGASIVVLFDDGDTANDRDVIIAKGNDSNEPFKFIPNWHIRSIAARPGGKLVIGGDFTCVDPLVNYVGGLTPSGKLDSSFVLSPGADGPVYATAVYNDKTFVAGSFSKINDITRNRIARLNADGSLDLSFDPGTGPNGPVYALAAQGAKVLVGGDFTSIGAVSRNRIARLNADGSLDQTFDPDTGADDTVKAIVLHNLSGNQGVLVGGDFRDFGGLSIRGMVRLNADDGEVDDSFVIPESPPDVGCLAVQSDGKILAAIHDGELPGLIRLHSSGQQDTNFAAQVNDEVLAIQVHEGGIYIAGRFTSVNGTLRQCIATLSGAGALTGEFSLGPALEFFGSGAPEIKAFVVQADGRVIIGGTFNAIAGIAREYIARINANGTLDTTFSCGDQSWHMTIPNVEFSSGDIELHVSDGQHAKRKPDDTFVAYRDPPLFINGLLWVQPEPMHLCDSADPSPNNPQIFQGSTVPHAHYLCDVTSGSYDPFLWDIRQWAITDDLRGRVGRVPTYLRHIYPAVAAD